MSHWQSKTQKSLHNGRGSLSDLFPSGWSILTSNKFTINFQAERKLFHEHNKTKFWPNVNFHYKQAVSVNVDIVFAHIHSYPSFYFLFQLFLFKLRFLLKIRMLWMFYIYVVQPTCIAWKQIFFIFAVVLFEVSLSDYELGLTFPPSLPHTFVSDYFHDFALLWFHL